MRISTKLLATLVKTSREFISREVLFTLHPHFNRSALSLVLTLVNLSLSRSLSHFPNPYLSLSAPAAAVTDTDATTVTDLRSSAWAHHALTALKLVAHLRGVRGTGKSDRKGFYSSAIWLHENHPKTLALNVASFAEFGYMKDLLEILHRILRGPDARKVLKSKCRVDEEAQKGPQGRHQGGEDRGRAFKVKTEVEKAAELRRSKRAELAKLVVESYNRVPHYFAGMPKSDAEQLKLGNLSKIGLAAKWSPSLDSSFDKSVLLCESIARRLWPKDSTEEYKQLCELQLHGKSFPVKLWRPKSSWEIISREAFVHH